MAIPFSLNDPPVVHVCDDIGIMEDTRVMGHDDGGAVGMNGVGGDQFHHCFAGRVVERGGRLVADDQPRLVHESAGDGDALLLAAGQRGGQPIASSFEAQPIEQRLRAIHGFGALHSGGNQGYGGVFGSGQRWQ